VSIITWQRKANLTVLCLLIIIILISYIVLYYYQIINYGEPSQPKPEMELLELSVVNETSLLGADAIFCSQTLQCEDAITSTENH